MSQPADASPKSVLSMSHISHAFDQKYVLEDFSLDVAAGETVCLLGASGCGKTTALRLAAGLEIVQQGQVSLNRQIVSDGQTHIPAENRDVGLVFQDYALFPHLSVRDNILFGLRKSSLSKEMKQERLLKTAQLVRMQDYLDAYPHMLSGGQQQRIALARALAPEPSLLLLDEPYSGLDSRLRDQLREETAQLLSDLGVAALMVTHDPEEAMYLSDRIALMNIGKIEQVDTPEIMHNQPASVYVAQFLSEVNHFSFQPEEGQIDSPFGRLDFPENTGRYADVIIRPEDIEILKDRQSDQAMTAKIAQTRLLGNQSLIFLTVQWQAKTYDLRVRQWGAVPWQIGQEVNFVVDHSKLFVYAS